MKVQVAAQGFAIGIEVPPKMLEPGKLYSAVTYNMDDSGEASMETDMVYCHLATLEGKKNIRVLRFLIASKTKRYSQIVGTRFFGPFTMSITEVNSPVVAEGLDIESILSKASGFQSSAAPVNGDNIILPTCIQELVAEASTCPSCGKCNATLQGPQGEEAPMYWCDPASGGCDELWEAKL